jgi:phasin family protein
MLRRTLYVALQQEDMPMADETTTEVKSAIEAPAKVAEKTVEAVVETAKAVAKPVIAKAKPAKPAARRAKRKTTAKAAKRPTAKIKKTAARKTARVAKQRTETMTKTNFFNGFDAIPALAPFQNLFADANGRGQEFAKRGQKAAEELAKLARANVEAIVEAGRVASEGARSIGQDAVSTSRDGFEQAADAIRSLAEAKSPTEYLQLQGELARASFDRMVAESSKLTESVVKLAGEAFQPISNRATANAERFNTLVA